MSKKTETEALSFEEAIERLESLVEAMEEGELPLDALVEKFEEGEKLARCCEKRLKAAELRIEKLKPDTSPAEFEEFDEGESES